MFSRSENTAKTLMGCSSVGYGRGGGGRGGGGARQLPPPGQRSSSIDSSPVPATIA